MDHDEVIDQKLNEELGYDRASLLKRLAVGGAALSLPALAGAQGAFAATDRMPMPSKMAIAMSHGLDRLNTEGNPTDSLMLFS